MYYILVFLLLCPAVSFSCAATRQSDGTVTTTTEATVTTTEAVVTTAVVDTTTAVDTTTEVVTTTEIVTTTEVETTTVELLCGAAGVNILKLEPESADFNPAEIVTDGMDAVYTLTCSGSDTAVTIISLNRDDAGTIQGGASSTAVLTCSEDEGVWYMGGIAIVDIECIVYE